MRSVEACQRRPGPFQHKSQCVVSVYESLLDSRIVHFLVFARLFFPMPKLVDVIGYYTSSSCCRCVNSSSFSSAKGADVVTVLPAGDSGSSVLSSTFSSGWVTIDPRPESPAESAASTAFRLADDRSQSLMSSR